MGTFKGRFHPRFISLGWFLTGYIMSKFPENFTLEEEEANKQPFVSLLLGSHTVQHDLRKTWIFKMTVWQITVKTQQQQQLLINEISLPLPIEANYAFVVSSSSTWRNHSFSQDLPAFFNFLTSQRKLDLAEQNRRHSISSKNYEI